MSHKIALIKEPTARHKPAAAQRRAFLHAAVSRMRVIKGAVASQLWAEQVSRAAALGRSKECIVQLGNPERSSDQWGQENWRPNLEQLRAVPVVVCPRPARPLLAALAKVRTVAGAARACSSVMGSPSSPATCKPLQAALPVPPVPCSQCRSWPAILQRATKVTLPVLCFPTALAQELGQVGRDGPGGPVRLLFRWHSHKGDEIINKSIAGAWWVSGFPFSMLDGSWQCLILGGRSIGGRGHHLLVGPESIAVDFPHPPLSPAQARNED